MLPLLPALLLALFAGWCGTFQGSASWAGAAVGEAAVLLVVAVFARPSLDPLRLGRAGRWLLAALLVAVAGSLAASPVPRAGMVGAVLLPCYLLLPSAVARAWERGGERAERAVAAVVAVIAGWSLLDWLLIGAPRPAMPLGHHNLLAAWLVITLPLAALPWRRGGRARWLAGVAVALVVGAVLASRSLGGTLALATQGLLVLRRAPRRVRWGIVALALAAGLIQGGRLLALASGGDTSFAARLVYGRGGLAGVAARPWLGSGPGSVPWTIGPLLRPVPGVSPPSEIVGQLHSLPLELGYEIGLTGLALAVAVGLVFALARRRERAEAADPLLLRAGVLGLAGGAVACLGDAWLRVPALALALAVAAGAALAGGKRAAEPHHTPSPRRWPLAVAALGAAAVLLRPGLATRHYERALAARTTEATREALGRAVALDPAFPLYRAHLAWYLEPPSARLAREAAEQAPGLGALWLAAGVLGLDEEEGWTPEALRRAMAADPLGALAPFYLVVADPAAATAADCGARALLADPRLAAAPFWGEHPELAAEARRRVLGWPGVEPGLREALAAVLLPRTGGTAPPGSLVSLAVGGEGAAGPFTRHAFGRLPWPAPWFSEPLDGELLGRLRVPAATTLATTSPASFPPGACSPAAR